MSHGLFEIQTSELLQWNKTEFAWRFLELFYIKNQFLRKLFFL